MYGQNPLEKAAYLMCHHCHQEETIFHAYPKNYTGMQVFLTKSNMDLSTGFLPGDKEASSILFIEKQGYYREEIKQPLSGDYLLALTHHGQEPLVHTLTFGAFDFIGSESHMDDWHQVMLGKLDIDQLAQRTKRRLSFLEERALLTEQRIQELDRDFPKLTKTVTPQ